MEQSTYEKHAENLIHNNYNSLNKIMLNTR